MTFRVWVADKLSNEGVDVLKWAEGVDVDVKTGLSKDEQLKIADAYDALIVRSSTKVDTDFLAAATKLKMVVRAGIGVDNIDIPACSEKGVMVANTPFGNATSAAEHAIALLFSLARQIPWAHASTHGGKWEKSKFSGVELGEKTLGVIGAGNIGAIVIKKARGLGMHVIAFDPVLTHERAEELEVEKVDLETLWSRADAITLHVPLISATRNIVNADSIAQMKDGVMLVNAARGGVVDEEAVAKALQSGKMRGAAFDVFVEEPLAADHAFRGLQNVILTPHLGASTEDAQVRVGVQAAEQVVDFLTSGERRNALN